jgi:hypothetical protein
LQALGFFVCGVWAPYVLKKWKWVESVLLNEWGVSESLLTGYKNPDYRKSVQKYRGPEKKSWWRRCCCESKIPRKAAAEDDLEVRSSEQRKLLDEASAQHIHVHMAGDALLAGQLQKQAWEVRSFGALFVWVL